MRAGLRAPLVSMALLACCAADAGCGGSGEAREPEEVKRPNVVVITTDDQGLNTFSPRTMPHTFRAIVRRGTSFRESIAAPPLCCPSRAGFLSGQYPHNNGVARNRPGYTRLHDPSNVLPMWLGRAGYRTGFVGKFMNGYSSVEGPKAAPGWDHWFALGSDPKYFGASATDGRRIVRLADERYLTTELNQRATDFIGDAAGERPFFLWLAQYAPHPGGGPGHPKCEDRAAPIPPAADYERFERAKMPRSPNFDEADVSDKPRYVRRFDRLGEREIRDFEIAWRCAAASLQEVDRGVARIVRELRETGELDETLIVFTSDNGTYFGEHRLQGKGDFYEEAMRVPLAIRAPAGMFGGEQPERVSQLVANIDLAPTLLELAGAEPCVRRCRVMDGRSLVPLLLGEDPTEMRNRGILVEKGENRCRFLGLRTPHYYYAEKLTRDRRRAGCKVQELELYDLRRDPHQLESAISANPRKDVQLSRRLNALTTCSGIRGRDPAPGAGIAYCE
jgi:N-acetylglucosamine-6-sulfatase